MRRWLCSHCRDSFSLIVMCTVIAMTVASAQTERTTVEASQSALSTTTLPSDKPLGPDSDTIISPDDVLDVYVIDVAELSRQYRVNPAGLVTLPLLPKPLDTTGLTVSQFSDALAQQLRNNEIVTNPHIVVTIASSRLKSVAITGAVKMPQIYPVFGHTTLIDVLSQAQGLSDDASNTAVISRGDLGANATNSTERTQAVDLKKLLQTGDAKYNIDIYPGDRITVPHAGIVYVVGAVNKPGGFPLRTSDKGVTVLQALAMAEDAKGTAMRDKSMIIRPDPSASDGQKMMPVNLNMILAGKAKDTLLRADDILFVPDSTAKKAFRRGAEAALQAVTYLAIYARP
jgi:polysaccharide biosynthesis/export protein